MVMYQWPELIGMPVSEEVMEMLTEQTAETVWGLERDSNGVIIRVQHHSPLDHCMCCYLPQGCEGGCTQPGGCCDPAPRDPSYSGRRAVSDEPPF